MRCMGDVIRRMAWFIVVAIIVSYATYLAIGSTINAQAASIAGPVAIRDVLGPGAHHLSGMVMVPSSCYQLSEQTQTLSSAAFDLTFTTWQDPAIGCSGDQVPRQFHETLFAPATGVDFYATLDGANLPIEVIPVVPDTSSQ